MAESWDIQSPSTSLLLSRSAPQPCTQLLHSHSTSSWLGEVKKPPTVTQQWKEGSSLGLGEEEGKGEKEEEGGAGDTAATVTTTTPSSQ